MLFVREHSTVVGWVRVYEISDSSPSRRFLSRQSSSLGAIDLYDPTILNNDGDLSVSKPGKCLSYDLHSGVAR